MRGREGGKREGRMWAALACLVLISSMAPLRAEAATRFGVDLGVNFSRLDYDETLAWWTDEGWRVSVTAGSSMEIPIGGALNLTTGFRYVRLGNRVEFDTGGSGGSVRQVGEFTIAQDYFTVPLLLTVRPRRLREVSFSFGPELGVLVAAALDYERTVYFSDGPFPYGDVVDLRDELEPVVLLGTMAAGFEFPRGPVDWCLQARSTIGLTRASREVWWSSAWRTIGIETTAGLRW